MASERIQRRIEALLDETDEAAAAGNWAAVLEKSRAVLGFDPGNEEAEAYLAAAQGAVSANSLEAERPQQSSTPPASATAIPEPSHPDTFVAGRYRVERFLGDGAKKRVFLARDNSLDRQVAFAQLRTEGLDSMGRQRLVREAQAMARLGNHPRLVGIFDIGEEGGTPFIVEEYMEGGDLAAQLQEAEGGLALPKVLTIGQSICEALAFIHERQLLHRDLKPSNVFLAEDGSAKVGDFGLAVSLDRSRLTTESSLIGTPSYMPPEQALGGAVTEQSDLYSLGAMLYELVTGRPPFVGDDPTSVISQHINTRPVAPSWHSEHCPPELEAIILQCLEKAPESRPASAVQVREALAKVDPEGRSSSHSGSSANPLDRLAQGVFVGRTRELERLRTAFDNAFAGHGNLVMLVGEPGIGKTRTSKEIETYARMRGARVLWGRAHEASGAPPYWPWKQIGDAHARFVPPADLTHELAPEQARELVRIFPSLPGEPPESTDLQTAQFQLFDAYTAFIRAGADRAPLLLVLDDLHWADKPSLLLLQHLAREVDRMRVLVLATYRDTDLARTHPLSEVLANLNREPGFERVVLRGLTRDEVRSYISSSANTDVTSKVLDAIFEETEGNPFFLSEVVNVLTEEGSLASESMSDIAVPDGVKEALGRRLDRLSDGANTFLQFAAIAGREFAYETMELLHQGDTEALVDLLEEGINARVIEETEVPGRYRFTHALMQETLLEELSTTRRVRMHGRVGEVLEQRWGDRSDEYASRLALHFGESATLTRQHADKAVHYAEIAGRQALNRLAWAEAARHFEIALERIEDDSASELSRPAVLEGLGSALVAMGSNDRRAFNMLSEALEAYVASEDRQGLFRVARVVGSSPILGDQAAIRLLRTALTCLESDTVESAYVEAWLGYRLGLGGLEEQALSLLGSALAIAERTPDERLKLTCLGIRATVADFNGKNGLDDHLLVASLSEAIGDKRRAASSHFLAAQAYNSSLDLEQAAQHSQRARELAEETRQAYAIVSAALAQGTQLLYRGDFANREPLDRALELGSADFRIVLWQLIRAVFTGDIDEAGEAMRRMESAIGEHRLNQLARALALLSLTGWWWQTGSERHRELAERLLTESQAVPSGAPLAEGAMFPAIGFLALASNDESRMRAWHDSHPPDLRYSRVFPPAREVVQGLIDERLGDDDEALQHYQQLMEADAASPTLWAIPAAERARLLVRLKDPRAADAVEELLEVTTRIGMKGWQDKALKLKLELQGLADADPTSSILAVSSSVAAERPDLSVDAAPDGTVTLMFSDIVDSTALNERLGDTAWMAILREHSAIVEREVAAHHGHVVKSMGDGFMVAFQSARDGLRCAIALQRAFTARNDSADQPIEARIGLHTGEAVRDHGDFFGKHVNLAARIGASAGGGEIVVSSLLAQLVEPSGEFALKAREARSFKGLEGEHLTYGVGWR
ncbi:MAG: protein kinase [Dehalococcoidia bacterium]